MPLRLDNASALSTCPQPQQQNPACRIEPDKRTPARPTDSPEEAKWEDQQALLVAHNDKEYAHVHVMLNVVNPETGLRLDDGFEFRRAQQWAAGYEQEQGRIYCEQRLLSPEARQDAPPRNVWMAFQQQEKEFCSAENSLQQEQIVVDDPKNRQNSEWKILKEIQQAERKEFFTEGKSEFSELRSSVYRSVREEFRERWSNFYGAQKDGADPEFLATVKADLVADQKAVLDARRDEACAELRESRDARYRELLDNQREIRADLRTRQEAGLNNAAFLEQIGERNARNDTTADFHQAGRETTRLDDGNGIDGSFTTYGGSSRNEHSGGQEGPSSGHGVGDVATGAFRLFDIFLSAIEGPIEPAFRPSRQEVDRFRAAAEDAVKQQREQEKEQADEESRQKQRSLYPD
jgi:hypothetical protein